MNPDQQELTLDESIRRVMTTLPPIIRDYITQDRHLVVIRNLIIKYNLHVDQGGILALEVLLLLMGIDTPVEFMQALLDDAKIDEQTVNNLAQDVNDQIFVPLRAQMKSGGGGTAPTPPQEVVRPVAPQIVRPPEPVKPAEPTPPVFQRPLPPPLFNQGIMIEANPRMPSHAVHSYISPVAAPTLNTPSRPVAPVQPVRPQAVPAQGSADTLTLMKPAREVQTPMLPLGDQSPAHEVSRIPHAHVEPPLNLPGIMDPERELPVGIPEVVVPEVRPMPPAPSQSVEPPPPPVQPAPPAMPTYSPPVRTFTPPPVAPRPLTPPPPVAPRAAGSDPYREPIE